MSKPSQTPVKALLFDVFGTVVDWRNSIMAELQTVFGGSETRIDAHTLALGWRALYDPSMAPIREGRRPYTALDILHRENLETLIEQHNLPKLDERTYDHLTKAWHRLHAWPDCEPGLLRLKQKYVLATLSNGNVALMVNLARFANLPWDVILGADWARDYKPSPAVYLTAAEALDLNPSECMMVAAHNSDLDAAQKLGLKTAFVVRPTEYGPEQSIDLEPEGDWDYLASDMQDLARQLGV